MERVENVWKSDSKSFFYMLSNRMTYNCSLCVFFFYLIGFGGGGFVIRWQNSRHIFLMLMNVCWFGIRTVDFGVTMWRYGLNFSAKKKNEFQITDGETKTISIDFDLSQIVYENIYQIYDSERLVTRLNKTPISENQAIRCENKTKTINYLFKRQMHIKRRLQKNCTKKKISLF